MSKLRSKPFSITQCRLPPITKPNAEFLADLRTISRHNKNLANIVPILSGRKVDLQQLYNEVASRGGHKIVTRTHAWPDIYLSLGLPPGCVEAGHGLRTLYQRYLEAFERQQRLASSEHFSADLDTFVDDDSQDADFVHKFTKSSDTGTADEIPDHLRESWHLSTDLKSHVEYESLEGALRSGLPNEVDFALNTILLMSSQTDDFCLNKNIHLLPLLLHSVGLIDHISAEHQNKVTIARFLNFWKSGLSNAQDHVFLYSDALERFNLTPAFGCRDYSAALADSHEMFGDGELFRVQLVATILRNLAVKGGFDAATIGRETHALRFIFLCICANHLYLRHLGLETLASLHFPVTGALCSIMRRLLHHLLHSCDRVDRIRGLQILRHLCEVPVYLHAATFDTTHSYGQSVISSARNADFLLSLHLDIMQAAITNMCVKDAYLVMLTLDVLYSLSCLGGPVCDRLLTTTPSIRSSRYDLGTNTPRNLMALLLCFLQFDEQTLGPKSLIRIKYPGSSSTITDVSNEETLIGSQRTVARAANHGNPNDTSKDLPRSLARVRPTCIKAASNSDPIPRQILPAASRNSVPHYILHTSAITSPNPVLTVPAITSTSANTTESKPCETNLPTKPVVVNNVQSTLQSPLDRQSGCREFALQWLKQHCTPSVESFVAPSLVYAVYRMAHASRFPSGTPVALSSVELLTEIRSMFPDVDLKTSQNSKGETDVEYLKLRLNGAVQSNDGSIIPNGAQCPSKLDNAVQTKVAQKRSVDALNLNPQGEFSVTSQNAKRGIFNGHVLPLAGSTEQAPINGVHKEITYVVNGPITLSRSNLTGGDVQQIYFDASRGPSRCSNLSDLVPGETNLLLVPVLTAVNLRPVAQNLNSPCVQSYPGVAFGFATITTRAPSTAVLSPTSCSAQCPSVADSVQSVSTVSLTRCRWASCRGSFVTSDELLSHLEQAHFSEQSQLTCHWIGCNSRSIFTPKTLREHFVTAHSMSHKYCNGSTSDVPPKTEPCSLSDLLQTEDPLLDCLRSSESLDLISAPKPKENVTSETTTSTNDHPPTSADLRHEVDQRCPIDPPVVTKQALSKPVTPSLWSPTPELSEDCKRALNSGLPHAPFLSAAITEDPLVKHIRVTAALVLKNFLLHSRLARQFMLRHEGYLCDLAFAGLDSSTVIMDCLSLLHEDLTSILPINDGSDT